GHIDVGRWFNQAHPQLAREEYSRQFIPTLEEVLNSFANKRQKVYVELKTDNAIDTRLDLARSVTELIDDAVSEDVIVISFDLQAISKERRVRRSIRTGALFEPKHSARATIRKSQMFQAAIDCGADEILLHRFMVTTRAAELAQAHNLKLAVWTVDDRK